MQEIKLKSVTTVFIDGESQVVANIGEMFDLLNIPNTKEYSGARNYIIAKLIALHEVDLSPAYTGHTVRVTVQFQ